MKHHTINESHQLLIVNDILYLRRGLLSEAETSASSIPTAAGQSSTAGTAEESNIDDDGADSNDTAVVGLPVPNWVIMVLFAGCVLIFLGWAYFATRRGRRRSHAGGAAGDDDDNDDGLEARIRALHHLAAMAEKKQQLSRMEKKELLLQYFQHTNHEVVRTIVEPSLSFLEFERAAVTRNIMFLPSSTSLLPLLIII